MSIKDFYTMPFRKGRELVETVLDNAKRRSSEVSIEDYFDGGIRLGAGCGGFFGAACGMGVPLYVGWNLGELINEKLDIVNPVLGTGVDLVCFVGFTSVAIVPSMVIFGVAGGAVGGVAGAAVGTVYGVGKKTLETVFGSNKEESTRRVGYRQ